MTSGSSSRKAKAQAAAPRQGANKAVDRRRGGRAGRGRGRRRGRARRPRQRHGDTRRGRLDRLPPSPSAATGPGGGIVVNPGKAKPGAPTLDLYEDFQCPICGQLEKLFGAQIRSLAAAGDVKLVTHTMSFLDDNLHNDSSLRAASAAACAADAGRFGPYHDAVYAGQPAKEGQGYTDAQLEGFAKTAGITGSGLHHLAAVRQERAAHGVRQGGPDPEREGRRLRHPDPQAQREGAGPAEAHPRVPHRTGQGRDDVSALTAAAALPATIPSPAAGRLAPRPLPRPRLRAVHPGRHRARRLDHRAAAGAPAAARRGRRSDIAAYAVPVRHRRRPALPRDHRPGSPTSARAATRSTRSRSGRAASASGARSRSARSAPGSAAAATGCRSCAFADAPRPGIARRPGPRPVGNWFNNELYGTPHRTCRGG